MSNSTSDTEEKVRQHLRKRNSMADPHPRTQADKAAPQGHVAGTLHIQNFGDEVLLSLEYRLPWQVALKVLRILKRARGSQLEPDAMLAHVAEAHVRDFVAVRIIGALQRPLIDF